MAYFKQISTKFAAGAALAIAAPMLVSTAAPNQIDRSALNEKEKAKLDKLLAGRQPGREEECITQRDIRQFTPVTDDIFVYRMRGGKIYVNQPRNGCPNVKNNAIITSKPTDQLCRGDIATIQDLRVGITLGGCSFGTFVLYEKSEDSAD